MSDIDITSGSAVAVDTVSLADAATAVSLLASDIDRVQRSASWAATQAREVSLGLESDVFDVAVLLASCRESADALSDRLREASRLYELVEIAGERELAALAGDDRRRVSAEHRWDALREADPELAARANGILAAARARPLAEFIGEVSAVTPGWLLASLGPLIPWVVAGAASGTVAVPPLLRAVDRGVVARGAQLQGRGDPVAIAPVSATVAATAPTGLAGALARIPEGTIERPSASGAAQHVPNPARIRIETYTMPDGHREHAVYIAGTRSGGPDEAFDLQSNLDLYTGERSASSEAVRAALAASGVAADEPLHVIGHSQGGMNALYLAQDADYDVVTAVTAGSPIAADLDPGIMSVTLVHPDDPVPDLADGGLAAHQGSSESFVVARTVDPEPGLHDLTLPAHHLFEYVETARMTEQSSDPRVGGIQRVFDHLATAETVTAVEYSAQRTT